MSILLKCPTDGGLSGRKPRSHSESWQPGIAADWPSRVFTLEAGVAGEEFGLGSDSAETERQALSRERSASWPFSKEKTHTPRGVHGDVRRTASSLPFDGRLNAGRAPKPGGEGWARPPKWSLSATGPPGFGNWPA